MYKGFWKDDKEHGKGTITVNGVVIVGIWKNGFFIKEDEDEVERNKENMEVDENCLKKNMKIKPLSIIGKGSEVSLTNSIAMDGCDRDDYGFFVSK